MEVLFCYVQRWVSLSFLLISVKHFLHYLELFAYTKVYSLIINTLFTFSSRIKLKSQFQLKKIWSLQSWTLSLDRPKPASIAMLSCTSEQADLDHSLSPDRLFLLNFVIEYLSECIWMRLNQQSRRHNGKNTMKCK